MKTRQQWKPASRLDSVMNVLLIVLALGVLGVGAFDVSTTTGQHAATDTTQRV